MFGQGGPIHMPSVLPELPISVSLHRLFPQASFVGCGDVVATDVVEDSRQANSSTVFAAIPGTQIDGTQFVRDAIERGCPAILTERPLADADVPQCVVPDSRAAFAQLCDAVVGHAARRLKIHGVTGTNGKTTVNWLIRSIFQSVGHTCGVTGTIEYHDGMRSEPARLTTPDARTFARCFRRMVDNNARHAAIELSSHALHQGRIDNVRLASAVVTNITQDHFDYHKTFEEYTAAKARILDYVTSDGLIAICADDAGSRQIIPAAAAAAATGQLRTFGVDSPDADIQAKIESKTLSGTRFAVRGLGTPFSISFPHPGRHNVLNALAAICVASHAGIPNDAIAHGLEHIHQIPGRLESIEEGQPYHVFVDYAHTDDALRRVIQSLKALTKGRVICVFGAGGDRDRTKRPLLAQAAALADIAVVTSDNPRNENPQTIIEDVLAGFPFGYSSFHAQIDRRTAISWALQEAQSGDCVLIAGKGHETYQIIGNERSDFDDREIVKGILNSQIEHVRQLHTLRRKQRHRDLNH